MLGGLNRPGRSAYEIYRQYHHMYEVKESGLMEVRQEWFDHYLAEGIDVKSIRKEGHYWWDREVLKYIQRYGTNTFRKLDIWDTDWKKMADHFGMAGTAEYSDPRNFLDRMIHRLLKTATNDSSGILDRAFLKLLRLSGW